MDDMKKKVLFFLAAALCITTVAAIEIPDWYEVEDWEIDVCRKWGGTRFLGSGASVGRPFIVSELTLAIQGEAYYYNLDNTSADNLYTVSWYFEPVNKMSFEVELLDDRGAFTVESGSANAHTPSSGYKVIYNSRDFGRVRIRFGDNHVTVPLVRKI